MFAIDEFGHSGASLNNFEKASIAQQIDALDALEELRQYDFDNVCLLKMDIEGGEYEVIPRIYYLIKKYHPNFYLSLHLKESKSLRKWQKAIIMLFKSSKIWPALFSYKHRFFVTKHGLIEQKDFPVRNFRDFVTKYLFFGYSDSIFLTNDDTFLDCKTK